MSLRFSTRFSVILATTMAAMMGCANWKASDSTLADTKSPLIDIGQTKKTPVIEISFVGVQLAASNEHRLDGIWQWIDETRIDTVQRRRLLANGIRVGIVSNEDQFRRRLESETIETDVLDEFLGQASIKSELSHRAKRLPLRYGRRHELPLRHPVEGNDVTMVRIDDETIGQTLLRPQYIFAITAGRAKSPKQIELKLRPEIQHGDARQTWISSDSAFRIDTRRQTWSLPELDIDVLANENDLLIVSANHPVSGLGKQMLTGAGSDQSQQQILLVIRIAQVGVTH